ACLTIRQRRAVAVAAGVPPALEPGPRVSETISSANRPAGKRGKLNQERHITGVAGNDAHQKVGFRGIYSGAETIRIEDTSPKILKELKLNWFSRAIARLCFGPLQPNRRLFHFQLDPYERSARFVNTHVLLST